MKDSIIKFVSKQKATTICYINDQGLPLCFSCFYALNRNEFYLYFKTSATSYHSIQMANSPIVAGTILPDKSNPLAIQGVQFEGVALPVPKEIEQEAYKEYNTRFPIAFSIPGVLWMVQINSIKMTDSSKIFGKKSSWIREQILNED